MPSRTTSAKGESCVHIEDFGRVEEVMKVVPRRLKGQVQIAYFGQRVAAIRRVVHRKDVKARLMEAHGHLGRAGANLNKEAQVSQRHLVRLQGLGGWRLSLLRGFIGSLGTRTRIMRVTLPWGRRVAFARLHAHMHNLAAFSGMRIAGISRFKRL